MVATLSLWEHAGSMLDAAGLLDEQAAGGVLVMNEKLRSAYTVMTTGIIMPMSPLGAPVEVLGELADVDAILAERGPTGSRRCLAGGNLESDVSNYFLCHLKAPLSCKILILDRFDLIKLEVDGRLLPNMETTTRTRSFSGSSSSTVPMKPLERAVSDLDGVAELIADHHFVVLDAEVIDFLFCQGNRLPVGADEAAAPRTLCTRCQLSSVSTIFTST